MEKDISKNYNAFTTAKGNIIWMGTMSLVWKEFAKFQEVKQLEFQETNEKAQKTIDNLNNSEFSVGQIS